MKRLRLGTATRTLTRAGKTETARQGRARIVTARRKFLSSKPREAFRDLFAQEMRRLGKKLRNGRIIKYEPIGNSLGFWILHKENRIGFLLADVTTENGKLEVSIETIQGEGHKNESDDFRTENKIRWNTALAGLAVKSAYWNGFDRIKLRRPETLDGYQKPYVGGVVRLATEAEADRIRERMRQLYTRTRKECGFTKTEGDYWVREFP